MDKDEIARAETARRGTPYLNTQQAAHYLLISPWTLQRLRAKGKGPVVRRHARVALYHIDDLDTWSRAQQDQQKPGEGS